MTEERLQEIEASVSETVAYEKARPADFEMINSHYSTLGEYVPELVAEVRRLRAALITVGAEFGNPETDWQDWQDAAPALDRIEKTVEEALNGSHSVPTKQGQ